MIFAVHVDARTELTDYSTISTFCKWECWWILQLPYRATCWGGYGECCKDSGIGGQVIQERVVLLHSYGTPMMVVGLDCKDHYDGW